MRVPLTTSVCKWANQLTHLAKQLLFGATGLLFVASTGWAAPIANLELDFTPVTFPIGWQYLRNTGPIGDNASYVPLLWDAANVAYDVTGSGFPAPGPDFTFYNGIASHPGRGTAQGAASNGYFIAAYTIQPGEAGIISSIGSLRGNDPDGAGGASNGWDILLFVGNAQVGAPILIPWAPSATLFSRALGALSVGDTVYVGVGPNSSHLFDSVNVRFQLDSTPAAVPEPGSMFLLISGLIGFGVRRWRNI